MILLGMETIKYWEYMVLLMVIIRLIMGMHGFIFLGMNTIYLASMGFFLGMINVISKVMELLNSWMLFVSESKMDDALGVSP